MKQVLRLQRALGPAFKLFETCFRPFACVWTTASLNDCFTVSCAHLHRPMIRARGTNYTSNLNTYVSGNLVLEFTSKLRYVKKSRQI